MIALVLIVMPLIVLVSSAITTMTTRSYGQIRSIQSERAMLAVESGLDQALYISKTIGLTSGTKISRTLGQDLSFEVEIVLASTDGIDNDGDTQVDEADENVYELTITGTYGRVSRRVVALCPSRSCTAATARLGLGTCPNPVRFRSDRHPPPYCGIGSHRRWY